MVKSTISYPDFSGGEVSPKLYGRFDLAVYYRGARRVENFISQVTGPAFNRTGTVFASATRDNAKAFMWTFKFTDTAAYALEFTPLFIRFYKNDGLITETAQAITGISQANPGVLTYSGADNYANGDRVIIEGVVGMTEVNNNEYEVANVNVGANTFELSGTNTTSFTAYSSGGTVRVITEVATTYTADDLFDLKFAQNGADLYIVHPSFNPKKLTYTSSTSWAFASHSPTALTLGASDYPSAVALYEQRLIYGGSLNNPQTLYFSKSGDVDDFTTGTAVDDGIAYTVVGGGTIEWLRGTDRFLAIGGFEDVLKATGGIDDVITPESISVKPTNSYGVADINPIGKGSQIFYMQKNGLIMRSLEYDFTQDAFFPADRTTVADHITGTGITQLSFEEGRPNIVWAIRSDGQLSGMTLEDSEDISGWHRHITDGSFISITSIPRASDYDQTWVCVERTIDGSTNYYIEFFEDQVSFVRREDYVDTTEAADDAKYARLIFEQQKDYIYMDSALTFDGSQVGTDASATLTPAATSGTSVTFTASAAVFASTDVGKQLWRKSASGDEYGVAEISSYTSTTVVTCEILEDFESTTAIPAGEWYLTTNSVSGLSHLEGESLSIAADGGQHSSKTVASGVVALDRQATVVHVGLPYISYLESNDVEGGGTDGPAQSKKKSLSAVGFRFLDSLFAKFGTDYYNLEQLNERTASMLMNRPPLMFNGDRKQQYYTKALDSVGGGWQREKRVIVSQEQPFPCRIQLIIPYLSTSNP